MLIYALSTSFYHRQVANCSLNKGKIIVIEGTDKAGKGTQSKMIVQAIHKLGMACILMDFPDYNTPIGLEIKAYLEGRRDYPVQLIHMLLSANRWEKKNQIEKLLEKGTVIIMNRYYQSNLVYGLSNGLELDWLINLDAGLPKEDLVILLQVTPQTSFDRVKQDRDAFEKDGSLMSKVYENYSMLSERFKWKVVDGEKDKYEIHKQIMKIVNENLKITYN